MHDLCASTRTYTEHPHTHVCLVSIGCMDTHCVHRECTVYIQPSNPDSNLNSNVHSLLRGARQNLTRRSEGCRAATGRGGEVGSARTDGGGPAASACLSTAPPWRSLRLMDALRCRPEFWAMASALDAQLPRKRALRNAGICFLTPLYAHV